MHNKIVFIDHRINNVIKLFSPGTGARRFRLLHRSQATGLNECSNVFTRRPNPAFTLLEVILALALTALVMVALGMAVDLHLHLLDSGRTKVEEAQLARAILRNIAQDLRGTVPYNAAKKSSSSTSSSASDSNTSSSKSSASSGQTGTTSQTGTKSSGQSGSSGQTGQSGKSGSSNQTGQSGKSGQSAQQSTTNNNSQSNTAGTSVATDQSASTTDDTSTTDTEDRTSDLADAAPQSAPGLYGNANELQIDVSRLPRVDQYMALSNQTDGTANGDQISDVKNVSYYVVNNGGSTMPDTMNPSASLQGLVRREIGRASGVYAAQQGQTATTSGNPQPFAPEVQAITFQYSDGTQWLDTWDSVSNSNLPVAVLITLAITPQHPRNTANLQPNIYRLMVSIPAAKPATSTSTSTSASTTSTSTSTTSQ